MFTMKHKPFDLTRPLQFLATEPPKVTSLPEVPDTLLDGIASFKEVTDTYLNAIGVEPDPTLVNLPTLASHEVITEVPAMYKAEPVPTSILDIAMDLVEESEKVQPTGTTAADIPLVAVKFDSGKADWSLLPLDATEEILKVLEFGAAKYDKNNWAKGNGFKWTRPFNAMLRHLFAWVRGEDNDPESGLSHIAHVGCNVLFLLTFILHKDRYNQDDRL